MSELPYFDKQIVPMILQKMESDLQKDLMKDVPTDDPTRSLSVELGRFRENPLDKIVHVALAGGDITNPDFVDGRIDSDQLDDITIPYLPVGEIGGGTYWWRRGCAEYGCYFVKDPLEYDQAMMYAYEFYGRLLYAIEHLQVGNLTDQFGEQSSGSPYIESSTFYESGGKKKHIWRGKVFWRVLTWRP